MRKFKRYIGLYFLFLKNCLKREMGFQVNFLLGLFDSIVMFSISLIFFKAIYLHVKTIAGWDLYQTLFLLGTYQIIESLYFALFINNLSNISKYVVSGDLDLVLVKPVSSQFYISTRYFYFGSLTNLLLGILLICYSFIKMNLSFHIGRFLIYILMIINGILIGYSLWFIIMTFSIWFGRITGVHEFFLSVLSLSEYPSDIYKGIVKFILTFIIPVIVIVNFPAKFFLGNLENKYLLLGFIINLILLKISSIFWGFALRSYTSASS